jgi:RNA-directed DNA polymerase
VSREAHAPFYESLGVRLLRATLPHVWVTSEKGRAMVRQLTAKDRVARTLKAISQVCRSMRTRPLRDQHQRLSRMLKAHYAYFGISGNYERLATLPYPVARIWRKWLVVAQVERTLHAMGCLRENTQAIPVTAASDCP